MQRSISFKAICAGFLLALSLFNPLQAQDLTRYVDPMTGTGGVGHTYPGATLPHGMVQLSPDTRRNDSWEGCAGYYHSDTLIYGFSHTHLSGTGCSDYGDILVMPGNGKGSFVPEEYGSRYRHDLEKATPGYYSVTLSDDKISAELTATTRTGFHRYSFTNGKDRYILIDLRHRDKLLGHGFRFVSNTRIEGYRRSSAWAADQSVYFAMEFSEPVASFDCLGSGATGMDLKSDAQAVMVRFSDGSQFPLMVKVGISTVDAEGARKNLDAELPGWDFEATKAQAKSVWNQALSRISAAGNDERSLTAFYTSLYHTMVVPNVISDVDGRYRGRDQKIHTANGYTQYTVFSLWDTFRATHPLYTLIDRTRTLDFIRTFLAQYNQGGRLPVWELGANETDCMIGYHSIPVIADALVKGVGGFDTSLAFEAMTKSATWDHHGVPAYIRRGYIAIEDEHESVSKTLEYAYDDWCIAEVAGMLGRKEERETYLKRALSYRNMFDPATGFMRPRRNGGFLQPFDPREVNNHYTEANSWQYSFFVPQDIPGLVKLMGGPAEMEKKLDALFSAPGQTTGRTQADITGLIGQYAHGNEPSHHMAYLYDYIGRPWKTQKLVRQILDSLYHKGPEGLPGNEDCGQMSAWYVWSAMGFYPVTPGSPFYAVGTPLFDSVTVSLENGKRVRIVANRKSPADIYVKSLQIDGRVITGNLITHDELVNAGRIQFILSSTPDKSRGVQPEARGGIDSGNFMRAPVFKSAGRIFTDSMTVEIESPDGGQIVFANTPDALQNGRPYKGPLRLQGNATLHAQARGDNGMSGVSSASFYRVPSKWQVTLNTEPSGQYTAEGGLSMIDGIRGTENWRKGDWHGYQGKDMDVGIHLGGPREIRGVEVGFLQDVRSWIVMPREVKVYVSTDGKDWKEAMKVKNDLPDTEMKVAIQNLNVEFEPVIASYVRVTAVNYGKLPVWHPGAGFDAFIFCDEVRVK